MVKIALLIGVSEYGMGLDSLPGTQTDIQSLQRVLQDPRIGGFDSVNLLSNPDPIQMQSAIEILFTENRSRDDLVLLYFSGHGVRDDNGTLYFATRITEKNSQGRIRTSTAVAASSVHSYMSQSRSKRQVLILDCCFSGAFANDMKAKGIDEVVDIKVQLGSEGRAVLTSSTATQVSFEKEGASIYTRYLTQGLETGAADRDSDGHITIDELHEYAKEKVQEASPTMQPEIYAIREGYKILIAQAPQGDSKVTYRKELDERAKLKRGRFSPIDQRAFKSRQQELGLSSQEAEQIDSEVLQPFRAFWTKLESFEQAVQETLQYDPKMSADSLDDLKYFQRVLRLRDEDTAPILSVYHTNLDLPEPACPDTNPSSMPSLLPHPHTLLPEEDDLSSEKGIDYTYLRDLLKESKWKAADLATYRAMNRAMGRKKASDFTSNELSKFPCKDLKTIDSLWVKYSNGKFGFSVQKQIYLECGGPLNGEYPGDQVWNEFCDRVGWRNNGKYVTNIDLRMDLQVSLIYPGMVFVPIENSQGWFGVINCKFSRLVQRLTKCNTSQS